MLSLPIVATVTVAECPCTKKGTFGMSRIPRFGVGRYMSTWNDNGISFDRFIMHDTGMTGRTSFILSTSSESLHVSAMTHDQSHLFDWWGEIAWGYLGHTKDMAMATETDSGIHFCLEIVYVGRR